MDFLLYVFFVDIAWCRDEWFLLLASKELIPIPHCILLCWDSRGIKVSTFSS